MPSTGLRAAFMARVWPSHRRIRIDGGTAADIVDIEPDGRLAVSVAGQRRLLVSAEGIDA